MVGVLLKMLGIVIAIVQRPVHLNEVLIPIGDFGSNGLNFTNAIDNNAMQGVELSFGELQAFMCVENSIGTGPGAFNSLDSGTFGSFVSMELSSNNTPYFGIPQNDKHVAGMNLDNQTSLDHTLPDNFEGLLFDFLMYRPFGIFGNLATIVYIVVKKKIRKPFFVCIVNLALADLICLLTNSYKLFFPESTFITDPCKYYWIEKIMTVFRKSAKFLALLAVLNMGIVRFLLFVYPLKSRAYLTTQKILIICGVSVLLSAGYGYLVNQLVLSTTGMVYYISAILPEAFFFTAIATILIVFFYKRFMTARRSTSAQNTKFKMTFVTLIILSLNILTLAVSIIENLSYSLTKSVHLDWFGRNIGVIVRVMDTIVHSINPYIYIANFSHLKSCLFKRFPSKTK